MVVSALIGLLVTVLVVALIAGLVVYLIRLAPFIDGEFKRWAEFAVYAIAILIIILRALPMLGIAVG